MNTTLAHRGPDDAGHWRDSSIGLAFRRLAILDLSAAGRQPMATPDGRWRIVFNGEIFNYRELWAEYLPHIVLTSTSDTEVLLHLLARYGTEALAWLRGMYALALWDTKKHELLLARDPFGKKPLYYSATPEALWFASEPKAILSGRAEKPALAAAALCAYCSYEYVPAPASIWADFAQVPAGTWLKWTSPGQYSKHRFWQPKFTPKATGSLPALLGELDTLLSQSVRRRLVSDVPVGLLLSGGLDSTTVGWYMRKQSNEKTHSFSVGFPERSFDESEYAEMAAQHLTTQHHAVEFTLDTFHQTLAELVPLIDEPLGDASLLPTFAVSKLARQFCAVVLDGDGSDELFGGYGTFVAARVAERLPWLAPLKALLQATIGLLPTQHTDFSLDFKLKSFVRGLGLPLAERNQVWLGSFTDQELSQLLQPAWYDGAAARAATDQWREVLAPLGVTDQVSLLTIYQYLHNDILVKLDRATMATSVEARTPFLDIDLVEFAFRLPEKYKRDKYIVKRLMAKRLPAAIVNRPKKGFGIPLGFWLKGPLYEWGRAVLATDKLAADAIFSPSYIDGLWREHRHGRADHRKKLWTLLAFQLWYDFWISGRSPYKSTPLARRPAQ